MGATVEIVSVDAESVARRGFFCRKSKMSTPGNERKLAWAADAFGEGLGIDIVYDNGRSVGFVEYSPGEVAWRAVEATGYLVEAQRCCGGSKPRRETVASTGSQW